MSVPGPPALFPPPAEGLELHSRLGRDDDRVAPQRFAEAYLAPLIAWLRRRFPDADPDLWSDAGECAILSVIRNPSAYDPARSTPHGYLCMAAEKDLFSLHTRGRRHRENRVPWEEGVEFPAAAGKGEEEDNPLALLLEAERLAGDRRALDGLRESLPEADRPLFDLMRAGVGDTASFAALLGLQELPADEQARQVKRAKDRVKAFLKRRAEPHA